MVDVTMELGLLGNKKSIRKKVLACNLVFQFMTKPLTKQMIEALMDCHEMELLRLEPYDASTIRSLSALIKRGMITTRPYINNKGKKILGVYVTNMGQAYLKNI